MGARRGGIIPAGARCRCNGNVEARYCLVVEVAEIGGDQRGWHELHVMWRWQIRCLGLENAFSTWHVRCETGWGFV